MKTIYEYNISASNYHSAKIENRDILRIELRGRNYKDIAEQVVAMARKVFPKRDIVEYTVVKIDLRSELTASIKFFKSRPLPMTGAGFNAAKQFDPEDEQHG